MERSQLRVPDVTTNLLVAVILLITFLFISSKKKRTSQRARRKWPIVPGAKPIIGNPIGQSSNFTAKVHEWADKYGTEKGIFECTIFSQRFYIICSEEKIELIESKRPFEIVRSKNLVRAVNSVGGNGLFSAEGHNWRKDRRMVGPALNKKNVADYLSTMRVATNRLIEQWSKMTKEDGVIAINSTILAFTMDVIASVGFGQELNSVTNGNNEMGNDILNLFQVAYIRYFSPIKYWKIPLIGQYLDGGGGSKTRLLNALTRLVNDYKASSKSGKSSEDYSKKAKTFLGKVVALNMKDPEALNTERLVGNLLTIFLAGAETSHVTIVSSLYEIASDKTGLQDELAAEAHALGDFEAASTNELMEKLPRMRSLVNEILRIKGPVAFLGLENVEPLEIEGTMIPANSNIVLAMQYISCQESKIIGKGTPPGPRFANPRDFCPRRWLIDSDGKPYDGDTCTVLSPAFKTGFRAFGSGMRVCPGRLLAEIEILIVLSAILCKFEISLEDGHPPMALITSFTEQPDIDIRLVLKARK